MFIFPVQGTSPKSWTFNFSLKGDVFPGAQILPFFNLFQCVTSSLFYLETEGALEAVLMCRVSLASWCASTLNFFVLACT